MASTETAGKGKAKKSSPPDIPLIDFSSFLTLSSTNADRLAIAIELVDACHNVGFVSITNHGVPPALLSEAFAWSKRLFDLKMEEKMLAPHPDGPAVVSDDVAVGKKLREVRDCKESYEIGHPSNASQPNVWLPPEVLPGFREFMSKIYSTLSDVSLSILRALGLGLGLSDPNYLLQFHSGMNNQLRLLHYPPIPARELEEGTSARMEAHWDWGSITLLFQDECGGLEVQKKDGQFVSVAPVKGALVMNVGDLLMRWSKDYLKSTLHRVTLPPVEDRFTGSDRTMRARYSIPYFVAPNEDSIVKVLEECASIGNPVRYEPVTQKEYAMKRARLQY